MYYCQFADFIIFAILAASKCLFKILIAIPIYTNTYYEEVGHFLDSLPDFMIDIKKVCFKTFERALFFLIKVMKDFS